MTTETPAEVLAEMEDRFGGDAHLMHYHDRLSRALSAGSVDSRTPIAWAEDCDYGRGYSFADEFFEAFPTFPNPPADPAKAGGSAPDGSDTPRHPASESQGDKNDAYPWLAWMHAKMRSDEEK